MASLQWFQARGYCQCLHYLRICLQPVWCLAATGLNWGPARHLHVLLWPSSDWVITLSTALTTPQHWWRERRIGETLFPGIWMQRESRENVGLKSANKIFYIYILYINHFTACFCLNNFSEAIKKLLSLELRNVLSNYNLSVKSHICL